MILLKYQLIDSGSVRCAAPLKRGECQPRQQNITLRLACLSPEMSLAAGKQLIRIASVIGVS